MKPIAAVLIAVLLAVSLAGCTAYRHNKAGDAAASTGDMRSAVYHYERALDHKEKYQRDTAFLGKLAAARSRVAFDDATRLRAEGRYEPAIDQLRESMRQDPSYTEPASLLPIVLKEAARWRYNQALRAADAGDLALAREHLMRSMQHDLADEASAYAMTSLTPEALDPMTPGLADYQQGLSESAQRRWLLAEATLLKSVAANSGLLPARAALHDARTQLAQAKRLQRDGQLLIDQLTMGPAIKSFNQSLAIWPFNEQASELLSKAKAQQALADEQFALATQAAGQAKWDDALALADSGLSIDRSHPGLDELRAALPRRAAADYTRRGDAHLAEEQLSQAHDSYTRALSYRSTYGNARQGLAKVYAAWASEHEQAGQLGAALLHYAKGQTYTRSKALDDGVIRMSAALRDRLGVGLSVSADEQRRGEIAPRQLSSALIGSLQPHTAQGLALQAQGMPYELRLSIREASIDEQRTNTARRTHRYTTQELRHNPDYPRVAQRYDHECRVLRRYEADLAAFRCKGHLDSAPCDCYKTGRYNQLKNQVSRQRRVVNRAKHDLECTPRQIRVTLHHDWHYTVETYAKTGEFKVVTELIDTASGKVVKSFTHQASFAQSDDRTLNSNPAVGVPHDDLRLASDDTVRSALTDELASAAAPWAVNALIDHRLAQLSAAIDAFEAEGKTDDALEARVRSALLIGIVDPKGSQQALDKLTESHTR